MLKYELGFLYVITTKRFADIFDLRYSRHIYVEMYYTNGIVYVLVSLLL